MTLHRLYCIYPVIQLPKTTGGTFRHRDSEALGYRDVYLSILFQCLVHPSTTPSCNVNPP